MLQIKILAFKTVFFYLSLITSNYLYIMITLFVTNGELIACLILIALLALYGWSKYSLAKQIELDVKVRNMSDSEIVDRFQSLLEGLKQNSTHWKGSEFFAIFKAHEKRGLFKNVPDTEIIDQYKCLKADYEQKHTFWKWKGFTYFQKEMKRRKLL